jgi:putative aminopeptidase FrvX
MKKSLLILELMLFGLVAATGPRARAAHAAETAGTCGNSEASWLGETPSESLVRRFKDYSPTVDNLGNVIFTMGHGKPLRVIATPIDEPAYVISEIRVDGFLRVQRLPQAAPNGVFDALRFAQPIYVFTRNNKQIAGVFAGLSVHLQGGRTNGPHMSDQEELYIDIGARNAEEARSAGVDILDRVELQREFAPIGGQGRAETGAGAGNWLEQDAVERVLEAWHESNAKPLAGTTMVVFVTQSWLGGRGLDRFLQSYTVDELIYVGRISPRAPEANNDSTKRSNLGEGVLLGVDDAQTPLTELTARLSDVARKHGIPLNVIAAEKPRIRGYAKNSDLPKSFVQLGLNRIWPVTTAETVSFRDAGNLQKLLAAYLEFELPQPPSWVPGGGVGCGIPRPVIEDLAEAYGASGHESGVREEVKKLLPEWAKKKVTTDAAGNLVLHWGDGKHDAKTPSIAFVAHMDELGFEVRKIEDDGHLLAESLGGGYPQYFLGHVALVHKKDGNRVGAVMELPEGWDKPNFEFNVTLRSIDEPAHVYVGTRSKEETEKLGIAVGDYVTIPKEYRPLLGTRANARSFDDRVGCTALIEAARKLGPDLPGRDVTFVWSTEEEVGLKGAAAFAEQAAKENRVPDFVFAIDTFVSSDSPLESKRFADAELGKGFVIRAVDNSNIAPLQYVDRVIALAKESNIPVQYGVTGGGNDGAVFTRYGSVDIPLGWPLRYSHSPAEVIDTKDLDALGQIVEVLARKW